MSVLAESERVTTMGTKAKDAPGRIGVRWANRGNVRHLSREGTKRVAMGLPLRPEDILWEGRGIPNIFHDEGEQFVCQVVFSEAQTPPIAYYLGLDNRTSLAEADTLASLSGEPTGNGYARQAVNSDATDWTVSQDSGDYQAKSKTVTFSATGGSWGPVTKLFLCTVATGTSGKLLCSLALSQSRTLASGESLQADMTIKISE